MFFYVILVKIKYIRPSNHAVCISMPRAEIELIMGMIRAYYIISAVTVDRMLKNQG